MINITTARLFFGLALAGLALGPAQAGQAQTPPPAKTSDIDKVGDTAEAIVEAPLKDLNIMKPRIPPELQAIEARPYALDGLRTCKQFSAAVHKLTKVLGPDVDSPEAQRSTDETPTEFVLSGAQSVAGGLIPGGGLIRKISGAEKAQKRAAAAVLAGSLRRAYLKGTAHARGCRI